jgi:hypothetical protein
MLTVASGESSGVASGGETVGATEMSIDAETVAEAETDAEAETSGVPEVSTDAVAVVDAVTLADAVAVADADGSGETVGEGVSALASGSPGVEAPNDSDTSRPIPQTTSTMTTRAQTPRPGRDSRRSWDRVLPLTLAALPSDHALMHEEANLCIGSPAEGLPRR